MIVRVLDSHIRESECRECFRCAVARALQDATCDREAHVYTDDGIVKIRVWSQSALAPWEVAQFVHNYDALAAYGETPHLPAMLPPELEPFSFELPDAGDPAWEENCSECEELRPPAELDDEGVCTECSAGELSRKRIDNVTPTMFP